MSAQTANCDVVSLLQELRSADLEDDELSMIVEKLDLLLPDPHWFQYALDAVPQLSAEEIAVRAFSYQGMHL